MLDWCNKSELWNFFFGQTIWKAKKTEEVGRKKAYVATYQASTSYTYGCMYIYILMTFPILSTYSTIRSLTRYIDST